MRGLPTVLDYTDWPCYVFIVLSIALGYIFEDSIDLPDPAGIFIGMFLAAGITTLLVKTWEVLVRINWVAVGNILAVALGTVFIIGLFIILISGLSSSLQRNTQDNVPPPGASISADSLPRIVQDNPVQHGRQTPINPRRHRQKITTPPRW